MEDYGLISGLAQGLKSGVEGYYEQKKRNEEIEKIKQDRALKKASQAVEMKKAGLIDDGHGGLLEDTSSSAYKQKQLENAYKQAQMENLIAQTNYLEGGKGSDVELAKIGQMRDPITRKIVPDPNSPFFQQRQAEVAKIQAQTSLLGEQAQGQAKKNKFIGAPGAGKPARPEKVTKDMRSAAGFAQRLDMAEKDLADALEVFNPTDRMTAAKNFFTPEGYKSEGSKKFNQARDNFINAQLRRESGAAISPTEYATADKQYFPVAGDTPGVLAQKARNRASALAALRAEAGAAAIGDVNRELGLINVPEQTSGLVQDTKVINGRKYEKVNGGWRPAQ